MSWQQRWVDITQCLSLESPLSLHCLQKTHVPQLRCNVQWSPYGSVMSASTREFQGDYGGSQTKTQSARRFSHNIFLPPHFKSWTYLLFWHRIVLWHSNNISVKNEDFMLDNLPWITCHIHFRYISTRVMSVIIVFVTNHGVLWSRLLLYNRSKPIYLTTKGATMMQWYSGSNIDIKHILPMHINKPYAFEKCMLVYDLPRKRKHFPPAKRLTSAIQEWHNAGVSPHRWLSYSRHVIYGRLSARLQYCTKPSIPFQFLNSFYWILNMESTV